MKGHFLIIGILLVIVSILISLNIFFQNSLQLEVAKEFSQQQQILAQSIAEHITDFMRLREERILYAARSVTVTTPPDRRQLEAIADDVLQSRRKVGADFGLVDGSGTLVFFEGRQERRAVPPAGVIAAAQAVGAGETQLVAVPGMLYVVAQVPGGTPGRSFVFVAVPFDEIVSRFSERLQVSNKGSIGILDKEGTLLYHPVQASMVGQSVFTEKSACFECHMNFDIERTAVLGGSGTTGIYIAPGGNDKVFSFSLTQSDPPLYLFVSSPFTEITAMTRESMKLYSYLIIAILMTTIVISTSLIYFNRKRIEAKEMERRQREMEFLARDLEQKVRERTAELFAEKEKLNSIVSAIGSGLLLLDRKGIVLWANRIAEKMAGFPLAGHSCEELCAECEVSGSHSEGNIETVLATNIFGLEGKYFQVTTAPVKGEKGEVTGHMRLIQDVTELRRMEEQLSTSEKLAAIGRLAAGIAHEIGNPLTSIFSFVQILQEMEQDTFKKESLETIAFHVNRISETIKQLSGFTRMPAGEAKECQINEVIEASLNLIQYDKRARGIAIVRELAPDLPAIVADANQLSQVFLNLVLNALDALSEGGTITVRSGRANGMIEVRFIDTGIGIPKEALIRIFDPFYTTKEKGTGLGLAVSYNILRKMNGVITVESEPDMGTTFTVAIPEKRVT